MKTNKDAAVAVTSTGCRAPDKIYPSIETSSLSIGSMRAETPEFSLVLPSECKPSLYTVCVYVNGSPGPDTFGAGDP